MQDKNVILVASAPTRVTKGRKTDEQASRQGSIADQPLQAVRKPSPDSLGYFFQQAKYQAATWLFVPRAVRKILEQDGKIFIDADSAYLAVTPSTADYYWLKAEDEEIQAAISIDKRAAKLLDNHVLVVPGAFSGYALEVHEKDAFGNLKAFATAVGAKGQLLVDADEQQLRYQASSGTALRMQYQPEGLRGTGSINGESIDFTDWADEGAYQSPYVTTGEGKMTITDGQQGYSVDYSDLAPVY